MIHLTEEESARYAGHEIAFDAAHKALVAASDPASKNFPVVLGHCSDPADRFTVKSGTGGPLAGLKVGSYFPGNDAIGQPRHNSLILIFDQSTGRIGATIEGGKLNGYRTAAADAVATDALARADASVLTLFGTGHQAFYEAEAVARTRDLDRLLVVGRSTDKRDAFIARLRDAGLPAEAGDAEAACRAADIVVTATTATGPLFDAAWIKPGTHVSSMGSDRTGKQELPPALLRSARLFCDLPSQSRVIGEFQHAYPEAEITAIGAVLSGDVRGRETADEITVFDSSGIALQDLYIAEAILEAAGRSIGSDR
ncbi:ornithine cyclodeaminase [Palleronia aestuarii]|uniref:Ornithine cyclodeaminase n=1 Tax=Palleronia aestuarii TaxID=568105 RepID=A0A2W7NUH0_9RHOB|nr:ornithine cyclodeaminase family protein [Palleronia aestuarii]PZX14882.1 ornithine cyclodeaminase [Palleronia aestuarii]